MTGFPGISGGSVVTTSGVSPNSPPAPTGTVQGIPAGTPTNPQHERIAVRAGGSWNARYRFLPWVDDSQGETQEMVDHYLEMFRDDTVRAALLTKVYAVASLDLQTHPAEDKPRDKMIAEFELWNMKQMDGGPARMIAEELLLPTLIKKYVIAEKIKRPEPVKSGKWAGKIVWKELKAREWATLEEDAFGNVTGVLGPGAQGGQVWFDAKDFVIIKNLAVFQRPISDLRAVWRWYYAKDTLVKLWLIGLEKFGNPYLIAKYTRGDEAMRLALDKDLASLSGRTYAIVEDGASIEFSTALSNAANFEAALDRCDKGIMIAVNGAFLQSLTSGTTDDRGDSTVQKSTTELFAWRYLNLIEDTLNRQLVPESVDDNFARAQPPTVTLSGVNLAELLREAQLDNILLNQLNLPLSLKDRSKAYNRVLATSDDDNLLKLKQSAGPGMMGAMPGAAPPMDGQQDEMNPPTDDAGQLDEPDDGTEQFADEPTSEEVPHVHPDDGRAVKLLSHAKRFGQQILEGIVGDAVERAVKKKAGVGAVSLLPKSSRHWRK